MKGIKQIYKYYGSDPVEFFNRCKDLKAIGGSWFWFGNWGMIIEPDLTENMKVNLETGDIIYT